MVARLFFRCFVSFCIVQFNSFATASIVVDQVSSPHKKCCDKIHRYGGRLGVYAMDLASGHVFALNATQRFPLCSTSKVMTVAAVLKKSMNEPGLLRHVVHYTAKAVAQSGYAPVVSRHVKRGMTVKALCLAAVRDSDNAAANLLMRQVGGPDGVTAFARSIGDQTFNLTRWEPELNTAYPGDVRDTSTPSAMARSLAKIVFGHVLAEKQRRLFVDSMLSSTTGGSRIRTAVPGGWLVADKTGTGDYGVTNDIAVIWSPRGRPIVLTVFYRQPLRHALANSAIVAQAAAVVVAAFSHAD